MTGLRLSGVRSFVTSIAFQIKQRGHTGNFTDTPSLLCCVTGNDYFWHGRIASGLDEVGHFFACCRVIELERLIEFVTAVVEHDILACW